MKCLRSVKSCSKLDGIRNEEMEDRTGNFLIQLRNRRKLSEMEGISLENG
jgi:hypothetical protein